MALIKLKKLITAHTRKEQGYVLSEFRLKIMKEIIKEKIEIIDKYKIEYKIEEYFSLLLLLGNSIPIMVYNPKDKKSENI